MTEAELYRFFIEQAAKVITFQDVKMELASDLVNIYRLADAHHVYAEKMMELAK